MVYYVRHNFIRFTIHPMHKRCFLIFSFCLIFSIGAIHAQQLSFHYLGSKGGMQSLASWNCTIDHYGFFWISTSDGLVRFNGKDISYYDQQDYPEINSEQISYVYCDSKNYLWLCSDKSLVTMDDQRRIQHQHIIPGKDVNVNACFEGGDGTIYALSTSGAFSLDEVTGKWLGEPWLDSLMVYGNFRDPRHFDKDRMMICFPGSGVLIFNTLTKQKEVFIPVKKVNCAARFDANSILVGNSGSFGLLKYRLDDPEHPDTITPPDFVASNNLHQQINYMVRGMDHKMYMTTVGSGLLCLDSTLTQFTQYLHDPVDPSTIINNSLRYIVTDSSGNIIITCLDGVNYANVFHAAIKHVNYFRTADGKLYDEKVLSMAEDRNKKLWACIQDNVLIYDPSNGLTEKLEIPAYALKYSKVPSPISVEKDRFDKMWIGMRNEGIFVFDAEQNLKKVFAAVDYPEMEAVMNRPRVIKDGKDDFIYIGNEDGLYRISHIDHSIDTFPDDSLMKRLRRARIVDILPVEEAVWVATSPKGAAWHYSFRDKKLRSFNHNNGLLSNRVYALDKDDKGNIFIGSYNGFSIIELNDTITNLVKGKGLISHRVESLESDNEGAVWLTNNYNLLKYVPSSGNVIRYGRRQGLSNVNFAIMSSAKLSDGSLAFGVQKGFILVQPDQLDESRVDPLELFLFYLHPDGSEIRVHPGEKMRFNYRQKNIRFAFAVNDMIIAEQVYYKYRLRSDNEGAWSSPSNVSSVDFNLDPGYYYFDLQAYDGYEWYQVSAPVYIRIVPPWWRQWWFVAPFFGLILISVIAYYRNRLEKYRRELAVTRQISELEAKALRVQMNPHFVFNSLNAIQECIVTGRIEEAYAYLSRFSKLLRMVLEHSDAGEVRLHEELEMIGLYISLEKLRFKDDMIYTIHLDQDLDAEEIFITPMLIQPHLENAIWHGLRHKEGIKNLYLTIKEINPGYLEVTIQDDGIGRKKAAELRQASLGGNKHKSMARQLSENRIEILKNSYPLTSMVITDIVSATGTPGGTKVVISIPILEKKKSFNSVK